MGTCFTGWRNNSVQPSLVTLVQIAGCRRMAKRKSRQILKYCPPSRDVMNHYTREVCVILGQKLDPGFNSPEVSRELAGFMIIVASIYADQLNQGVKS